MSPTHSNSGAEFPPTTYEEWEAAASGALRGRPVESLATTTIDGIVRAPLYTAETSPGADDRAGLPGAVPHTRGGRAGGTVTGWEVRQTHDAADPAVNGLILRDLERGVTAITLDNAPATVDELDEVLAGVYLDLAPVHLGAGSTAQQRAALRSLLDRRGVPGSSSVGCLGADPFGYPDDEQDVRSLAAEAVALGDNLHGVRAMVLDGRPLHEAGAGDVQELGALLSAGVAWLRALTDAGLDVTGAAARLEFTVTVGPDQFASIAKLRAARTCWSRIVEAAGGDPDAAPMFLHAETASAMFTQRDPWVNMLRCTTACFSAAVGGADAITVLPFDAVLGAAEEFGLRIARNTQLILSEESHLNLVIDPAGGSWYVEDLTEAIARSSWAFFQDIERQGGRAAVKDSGWLEAAIAGTKQARTEQIATRAQPITGISEFPDIDERPPLDRVPAVAEDDQRWAAPFERLRDAADRAERRPEVYLANLGSVATHTARATFAKNLFEAGGIRATGSAGSTEPAEVAAGFAESGCRIACICSSDAVYDDIGPATAAALVAAGASRVYLAGPPGAQADELRAAGVAEFVHLGCDVLAVLRGAHDLLS